MLVVWLVYDVLCPYVKHLWANIHAGGSDTHTHPHMDTQTHTHSLKQENWFIFPSNWDVGGKNVVKWVLFFFFVSFVTIKNLYEIWGTHTHTHRVIWHDIIVL